MRGLIDPDSKLFALLTKLVLLMELNILAGLWALAVDTIPDGAVYVLYGLLLTAVLGFLYLDWALILQSRYVYTVGQCLKNALLAWMQDPGSTVVYLVSIVIPVLLCLSVELLGMDFWV